MDQGTIIAERGTGTRLIQLVYETTIRGIDYGFMVDQLGRRSSVVPVDAALAKGYWREPATGQVAEAAATPKG